MSADEIIALVFSFLSNRDLIAKVILVPLVAAYTLFAIILLRQVILFSGIIQLVVISSFLKILALIHVILASLLLFYVLFIL